MSADALVFPVGHYVGVDHDPSGPARHAVRVGRERTELADAEFETWLLAHGATADDGVPWTVGDLTGAAREAGVDARLDPLTSRGLAVLVEPGGGERFARRYRVAPLQIGFGNHDEAPTRFGIGLPGTPPAAVVDPGTYQLWLWGAAADSLWDVCVVLAGAVTDNGGPVRQPADVLADLFGGLRTLLARSAAYLDVAS